MNESCLEISKASACLFKDYKQSEDSYDNLFVLTHLGQLKQMEALISSKNISNNCLVVLYSQKNLTVPKTVHDQYSSAFKKAIFVEIPFGINKLDFPKLKKIEKYYKKIVMLSQPRSLYLNSFEGHYAVLTSIAQSQSVKIILVEEGTATYKFNLKKMTQSSKDSTLSYNFVRKNFMSTVGETQSFKKLVKIYKNNKELYKQSKIFVNQIVKDEKFQKNLIEIIGSQHVKASLVPFKEFDKAYASFPSLIKEGFGVKDVDYFLIHEVINDESEEDAREVIEKYNITENDVLYVSQRYHLDPEQYANTVTAILTRMISGEQTVFIKLHPKENKKIYDSFKYLEFVSNKKFVVIEESQFLIESVIRLSKISQLVGLTSTTLVYGPLVSPTTKSISIAQKLIKMLPPTQTNIKGIETIESHLDIIKIFDNIEFK
ncbi:alpha-2,8-polysialyltransferase family protein [Psychrobacter sp.]|uniref:alpha-2,8-polysialyltransferase family protein n=1 Tax=Psychrobacter sp. TaxID=56811 RepID=UPI003C7089FF|tara:strand:+ start:1090 stop:2382 length:1293 start_codon:yes stop_codon:yes gene_type:complete